MEKWWGNSTFYEIYMPSFMDGNGDGIGDFQGITEKLDYLKELGIDGIWLTPFYPSPKVDNGYDISDYVSIDPVYGVMKDFEVFIQEAHGRNIKVIVDLVLNHTSSQHQWFLDSRSSKSHPKRDWYIWRDQPNNWESFFGGSAWEYDEKTKQYYYHAFAKDQVDLNWANPEVKEAMFHVMKFWLEKGVDGFRLDVINFLKVNDSFWENPFDEATKEQIHLYDKDQEGILNVLEEIAEFVHQYPDTFLVGEVGSEDIDILKRYSGLKKLDVVFNFNIGSMAHFDPDMLYQHMLETEKEYDSSQIPTLFFSSHDMPRFISRFGNHIDRAQLFAALMLTARGVPFIYYGDEIGMRNWVTKDIREMKDVQGLMGYQQALKAGKEPMEALSIANDHSRDKSRTPMQWNSRKNAGFSEQKPWITIPDEASQVNVEEQQDTPDSMLYFYKKLLTIRKKHVSFTKGKYEFFRNDNGLFSYLRSHDGERILVLINFTDRQRILEIEDTFSMMLLSNKRPMLNRKMKTIFANEVMLFKEEVKK